MVRKTLALAFVVAQSLVSVSAQTDVSGAWDLTINGPQGTITAGMTMKQAGEKVTGTLNGPQGDVDVAGSMSGSTLKLSFSVNTPQGNIDITMTGEVTGGEMKGMLDFGMGQADFTGKRK
jgi:hypothetical protein